ncbi:MAG: glycoside hydrolase family 88 protein [Acidobacteriaceae bacterium]|nr:glycoside hydrolase family 88 protein [Acidobacteriaceae bacterium]
MISVDMELQPAALSPGLNSLWQASAAKILSLEASWKPESGAPVFTVAGRYTSRGWTEWTQGFQFGAPILQFDATGDERFLEIGREHTRRYMAPHITHTGVHDHGFNNVSTYGNLLRLLREGRIAPNFWEEQFYILALQCSGAVQAARWSDTADGLGYIYSFNGPHSLFVDTMRTLRALSLSHRLGHVLMGENDQRISLLDRMIQHARTTANHIVFYGEGRDAYDIAGRTAHEIVFNRNDGNKRCPSSQQGYSPFTTWTRGLAWAMLGYAEQLEFLATEPGDHADAQAFMLRAACATCNFYLAHTPTDGVPYWDTGAPGLARMGDYLSRPADPYNAHEPVDSSAAAIAAQALLRLGRYLDEPRYFQAGLTVARTLLAAPYLSTDPYHQGLLLHSIYHRPNAWDYVPPGSQIPCGESCQWGDYHLRELGLYLGRLIEQKPYLTFWS